jgi:hypothetical protein
MESPERARPPVVPSRIQLEEATDHPDGRVAAGAGAVEDAEVDGAGATTFGLM